MPDRTLLAVSLTHADSPLPDQAREAIDAGAQILELRCDCISDYDATAALLNAPRAVPYIVTVRSAAEGGRWTDDEAARIRTVKRYAALSPDFLDLEWRADFAPPAGDHRLILSHHDLAGAPENLNAVFDQMDSSSPDVVKAVFTARDALDSLRVLQQLHKRGGARPLIALAMGEAGLATRVLAAKFGALLTFAALRPGAESAPGQPTLSDLRNIYRWDNINRQTRVFGVIGWPVSQSMSPPLHNAAMDRAGVNGIYLPLPVEPSYDALDAFLDYVAANAWLDLDGLSVTIPHKQNVVRWLESNGHAFSETAGRCGAANMLIRTPNGWLGENTDAPGAVDALQSAPELAGGRLDQRSVDILGAGGAARALIAALSDRGCNITIYNRDPRRAAVLAQEMRCRSAPWDSRADGAGEVLINCTSVGMTPDMDQSPVPRGRLESRPLVFDTIYNPSKTRLLRDAESAGCPVVSGVEMFLRQAARQFELWHHLPAPEAELRRVLRSALG